MLQNNTNTQTERLTQMEDYYMPPRLCPPRHNYYNGAGRMYKYAHDV